MVWTQGMGVEVYIDDILIFSRTMTEHIDHLRQEAQGCTAKTETGKMSLPPTIDRVPGSLLVVWSHQVAAVREFPVPENMTQVRQFLGLSLYYSIFINKFGEVASPHHALTRKNVEFDWTPECQHAFETLKEKLIQPPVLSYPIVHLSFRRMLALRALGPFSQRQDNSQLHSVAYASPALSAPERNYGISVLKTLVVVWAIQNFLAYHHVTVVTDHLARRAILETPSPSGKHAQWWLKISLVELAKWILYMYTTLDVRTKSWCPVT